MLKKAIHRLGVILGNPRFVPFLVQRRVMQPKARGMFSNWIARMKPTAQTTSGTSSDEIAEALAGPGIYMLGQRLTAEQSAEVVRYFSQKEVHDPYRPEHPRFLPDSDKRHVNAHIAHHAPEDTLKAPYLFELANDPKILASIATHFGCKPTIGYMAAWWSYNTPIGAQQAELFHRDVDDWKFIKLFMYLTDVGEDSGPHVYVKGSASSPELCEIRRFTEEEVTEKFGKDNILSITGKAGSAFVENTFGIHRGQPVKKGTRLLFQVVYSLTALPYAPKQPVASPSEVAQVPFDPWINRHYVRQ